MEDLSLYLHIPFCKKKCLYCDFPSYANCENIFADYVASLIKEIKEQSREVSHRKISTIFVGGGTPTVLPPQLLLKAIDTVLEHCNVKSGAERTVETNPGTVDKAYFKELRAVGVNRLSFGVQAWQNNLLKTLGRIHDNETFVENFKQAREEGFNNISCDLMFALPTQTLSQWEETLEKIINLNPQHISTYSLIVEEGTPFKTMFDQGIYKATNEGLDREMYYLAKEMLKDKGYNQYEISNFAKPGMESSHNITYWQTKEYLGMGLGAHSYINNQRFHNTYDVSEYIGAKGNILKLKQDIETLSLEEKIEEFMFLGLRMTGGISLAEFKMRFGNHINHYYKEEIDFLLNEKLIATDGNYLVLTPKGVDISNFVFEKFIIN